MKKSQLLLSFFVCLVAGSTLAAQTPAAQGTSSSNPPQESGDRGTREGRGFRELLQNATSGTVQTVTSDGMTVKKIDGTVVTVKTTKDTQLRRERQTAKLTDFKPGDPVIVAGDPAGENTVTAKFIALRPSGPNAMNPEDLGKKFIMGEVMKIEETKLTIKRPDGVEQVIEVDDDTSFKNSKRESVTLADVKVGDRVVGRGEVKNGNFVAATLATRGPRPQAGKEDRPEHFGPDWIGGATSAQPGNAPPPAPKQD